MDRSAGSHALRRSRALRRALRLARFRRPVLGRRRARGRRTGARGRLRHGPAPLAHPEGGDRHRGLRRERPRWSAACGRRPPRPGSRSGPKSPI
ncbi:MAG: hypothetical protein M0C28_07420 [Candidatus Moduliflexus flocculans]|nr:hypothetical protein [Candidatus Moduliflexus flocculans]